MNKHLSRTIKRKQLMLISFFFGALAAIAQPQSSPKVEARAEFIEVAPNVRLHVTDLGDGQPVVLIHGWPLSDAMYEYQYQYLVKNHCRVIGITLRGFGASSKPYGPYNYDVFADDISKVLQSLHIEHAVLGGFSMGGAVCIRYMEKYKGAHVSKLALFAAAAPSWTKQDGFDAGSPKEQVNQLIALNNTDRPKLLNIFAGIFTASDSSLPAELGSWLGTINMQASSYAMEQSLIALRDTDLRKALPGIQVPTVIFHGIKDKICPYALAGIMQKSIPQASIVTFENSGHALFLEEADKFNTSLLAFIQQPSL